MFPLTLLALFCQSSFKFAFNRETTALNGKINLRRQTALGWHLSSVPSSLTSGWDKLFSPGDNKSYPTGLLWKIAGIFLTTTIDVCWIWNRLTNFVYFLLIFTFLGLKEMFQIFWVPTKLKGLILSALSPQSLNSVISCILLASLLEQLFEKMSPTLLAQPQHAVPLAVGKACLQMSTQLALWLFLSLLRSSFLGEAFSNHAK